MVAQILTCSDNRTHPMAQLQLLKAASPSYEQLSKPERFFQIFPIDPHCLNNLFHLFATKYLQKLQLK